MTQQPHRVLFLERLDRCKQSNLFVPDFYKAFMTSSDAVRDKFKGTDFATQNRMLLRSIELIAHATNGDPHGLEELNERAVTHDRHHRTFDLSSTMCG